MLILDCANVCYREAYAKAGLFFKNKPTAVIYGFLQQLRSLMARFPGEVCFCWDSKESLRKEFYPQYKANRHKTDIPEQIKDVHVQMNELREYILPRLGLPNHALQSGYEADDLMAALCNSSVNGLGGVRSETKVIVSSDNDLFQLLGPRVMLYNIGKKQNYTYKDFQEEFGVLPRQWPEVKAIAGDTSDNIEGIVGVGIKTAVKYLLGQKVRLGLMEAIDAFPEKIARNRKLVTLPWSGTDPGEIQKSSFNEREFMRVCVEYGLESFMGRK